MSWSIMKLTQEKQSQQKCVKTNVFSELVKGFLLRNCAHLDCKELNIMTLMKGILLKYPNKLREFGLILLQSVNLQFFYVKRLKLNIEMSK